MTYSRDGSFIFHEGVDDVYYSKDPFLCENSQKANASVMFLHVTPLDSLDPGGRHADTRLIYVSFVVVVVVVAALLRSSPIR